jgi:hypothetical protein
VTADAGQNLGRLSFWTFTFFIGTMALAILLGMIMSPPPHFPPHRSVTHCAFTVWFRMAHTALRCFRVMTIRPGEGKDLGSGSCGGGNKEVEALSQPGKVVDPLDRRGFLCVRDGVSCDDPPAACSTCSRAWPPPT